MIKTLLKKILPLPASKQNAMEARIMGRIGQVMEDVCLLKKAMTKLLSMHCLHQESQVCGETFCKKKVIFIPLDNMMNLENPYVCSIVENIEETDEASFCFIDGATSFWEKDDYDVVHFMWPTSVLIDGRNCDEVGRRIDFLKDKGITVVATCHNLVPHYDQDPEHIRCYELVYEKCDEIYHLGAYSFNLFEEKYPGKNKILYHQVYTKRYTYFPNKEESRRFLHLKSNRKYVLCFGAVRSNEERELIRYCAKTLRRRVYFLVPSYFPACYLTDSRNLLKHLEKRCLALLFILKERIFYPNILFSIRNKVPDQDIPYWFSACDIGFIHRCRILNSGNLPLNYYYGNVVVGPDVGNVGAILKETCNPVFSVRNYDTAAKEILKGLQMQADGLGKRNRDFAVQNWSEEKIAAQQAAYYEALLLMQERQTQASI